ncbi:class II aldolase/adducin family protein [Paenibacillus arenilitoris]|uniref:Class II aldolase/adducin family protein n=1 Tax=Paenibacillus arenilitoris TaxID=2772299 RepID=A0A927CNE8_9BACL|nr:class II aldolase/adducin family protein [Paenibacillus arenilitoris]MBD2868795.1 class II aldolase/adducin family protein [Paenibacillus arenilitoris]
MKPNPERKLWEQLRDTGMYMLDNGLAWGNAGNISARVDEDRYLITASGTDMGELAEGDFALCSVASGKAVRDGGPKPSKEVPMHQAVYELRPEINAVLHASPFYSTMIACTGEPIPADWFVEAMYYLERIERVPYFHPGSRELGEAVRAKAGAANILLLENHGVLVYDTSLREARMALHTLETVCRMMAAARSSGVEMRSLSRPTVDGFLNESGYRPRRKWSE